MRMRRGQVIIEAMIALGVLTIGFLGVVTLLSRSLSLNRVVADDYAATYLAAEGIEVVKNLIDANTIQGRPWGTDLSDGDYELEYDTTFSASAPLGYNPNALVAYVGRAIRVDPATKIYSYRGSSPTSFTRRIRIANVTADEVQVNAIVRWTARGGANSEINLEDHFFRWRP